MVEIKKYINNKYVKKFTGDVFFNTLAFAIYIFAQQICVLPILARKTDDNLFSIVVIFISVYSIICNSIGNELGITRQVRYEEDLDKKVSPYIYDTFIMYAFPIIAVIAGIILGLFRFDFLNIISFAFIIALGNLRLYLASFFRLKKEFKKVVLQNIMYTVGLGIGLILFFVLRQVCFPFACAEICSVLYSIWCSEFSLKHVMNIQGFKSNYRFVSRTFTDLSLMSLLTNMMVYFDKLVMYPILGAKAVAVYYAANSMSKAINLIVNPVYGVVLSWLGTSTGSKRGAIVGITQKLNFPVIVLATAISWPVTYVAIKLLYPQYFSEAFSMILPICVSVGFSVANSITKGVLLKFYESRKLLLCNISYFLIFMLLALPWSHWFGINGFVYANVVARIEQWVLFMLFLSKAKKIKS